MRPSPIALLGGAALLAAVPAVRAQGPIDGLAPEARDRYQAGLTAYEARDFQAAARDFAAAYALDPRREILFAEAQATRLSGDCPAATRLFERFLATAPPAQQVEATRLALARCQAAPPESPPIAARPAPPAAGPMVAPPAPRPPRWYHDRLALALAGAGVVAIGAGAALLASATARDAEAGAARTFDAYRARRASAETRWRWGALGVVTGSALFAAGAGRFVWVELESGQARALLGGRF